MDILEIEYLSDDNRELTIKVLVENVIQNPGWSYDSDWDFYGYTDVDFSILEVCEHLDDTYYLSLHEDSLSDSEYDTLEKKVIEKVKGNF